VTGTDIIEVRRNTRLAATVAVAATLVAAAFLWRGGAGGIVVGVLMLLVAVAQAWTAYDGRTPLLLVDEQGVRIRLGRAWRGIPWSGVEEIEHLPRRAWWRDGRLAVLLADEDDAVAELPAGARRQARLTQRLYGVPFAVPLGIGTRVVGAGENLTAALAELAGEEVGVVEVDPVLAVPEPAEVRVEVPVEESFEEPVETQPFRVERREPEADERTEPVREDTNPRLERPLLASPTPSPLREPTVAIRTDLRWQPEEAPVQGANALRLDPAETETDDEHAVIELPDGVTPIARPGQPVEPITFDDVTEVAAVAEPVIGPELAAARTRLGLSIETLAERTRIRPHVIESIEVDDFAPCGGDFYARGHLRTLARVLGVDAAPLLKEYDERYADGPVNARTVFEAELATGPTSSMRRMRGGPNWSVLIAAVMAVVLVWSVARLVMDGSGHPPARAISLDSGSAGTTNPYGKTAAPIPVTVTAASGGAHVVIRDSRGQVVFTGDLAFGETRSFKVSPPLRIQTSDGSVTASVAGEGTRALGKRGEPAQKTFTGPQ
jgi:hypothetical protein